MDTAARRDFLINLGLLAAFAASQAFLVMFMRDAAGSLHATAVAQMRIAVAHEHVSAGAEPDRLTTFWGLDMPTDRHAAETARDVGQDLNTFLGEHSDITRSAKVKIP